MGDLLRHFNILQHFSNDTLNSLILHTRGGRVVTDGSFLKKRHWVKIMDSGGVDVYAMVHKNQDNSKYLLDWLHIPSLNKSTDKDDDKDVDNDDILGTTASMEYGGAKKDNKTRKSKKQKLNK